MVAITLEAGAESQIFSMTSIRTVPAEVIHSGEFLAG